LELLVDTIQDPSQRRISAGPGSTLRFGRAYQNDLLTAALSAAKVQYVSRKHFAITGPPFRVRNASAQETRLCRGEASTPLSAGSDLPLEHGDILDIVDVVRLVFKVAAARTPKRDSPKGKGTAKGGRGGPRQN
jgi:hypothetical protein